MWRQHHARQQQALFFSSQRPRKTCADPHLIRFVMIALPRGETIRQPFIEMEGRMQEQGFPPVANVITPVKTTLYVPSHRH